VSSRRTMILIAAIAVGLLAAFLVFNYVQGADDRANQDAQRVDVFVIEGDIARGLSGTQAFEQGLIVEDQIPQEFLPPTAITDPADIDGQVALNNLAPNQVLVNGMFVDPADAQVGFSELLDEGRVAVTVSLDQVRGVAGLLVPGDRVNMLVTQADADGAASPLASNARYLFQDVEVLAVGTEAAAQPGENITETAEGEETEPVEEETGDTGLITFSVPPEAAQLIASVPVGSLYLNLVPEDYEPQPLSELDIEALLQDNALPGEQGDELTPYGPDGGAAN
jgi:pilus assembly protein CpaB